MEYGSFKQCVNIYYESSEHGPIRGQQCLVKITPTANIVEKILGFRNITHAVRANFFLTYKNFLACKFF